MPLLRAREPFDHAEWLFELKHDGFRALAIIEGHRCRLVSRNRHDLRWPQLAEEIAHSVRARNAMLDGEIVCLKADGGSDFYGLMFRRERPYFYAFDALSIEGRDIRQLPLLARKRALRRIMPRTIRGSDTWITWPARAAICSVSSASATPRASWRSGRRAPITPTPPLHHALSAGWSQTRVGPEFQVNSTTYADQVPGGVASDANGNFVVVWQGLHVVASQPRGKEIHIITDNLSAHKTRRVQQFLDTHTHVYLHFTPTYSS